MSRPEQQVPIPWNAVQWEGMTPNVGSLNDVLQNLQGQILEGDSPFETPQKHGAVGDGITDDTAAVQAAVNAAGGGELYLSGGTFLVSVLSFTQTITVCGPGTIKRKASSASDMIVCSGTSKAFVFNNVTLDGNQANQVASETDDTLRFQAIGTATAPSIMECTGVTFINGNGDDISVSTDTARATTNEMLIVRGCKFLGGREGASVSDGPAYIRSASPISYVVEACMFDFLGTPVIGRAGIVMFDGSHGASAEKPRGVISGNFLQNVGRSETTSTLGAIDLYTYGRSVTIIGNTLISPNGRGIQAKADCENLAITGNVIDGLTGATVNAQIVVNSSLYATVGGPVAITGNSCYNSTGEGISYTGANLAVTVFSRTITISGNVVSGSTGDAIRTIECDNVTITGNSIQSSSINGIRCDSHKESAVITGNHISDVTLSGIVVDSVSPNAYLNISSNHIQDAGNRGILVDSAAKGLCVGNTIKNTTSFGIDTQDIGGAFLVANNMIATANPYGKSGANGGLRVADNMYATAPSFTARKVTIASGAITVHMDWHYVDTEAAAATDYLDTINGGFDGVTVSFKAADATHDVVFKDGTGNMRLAGDFTLSNSDDTISLRYMGGNWYELSRSDLTYVTPQMFGGGPSKTGAQNSAAYNAAIAALAAVGGGEIWTTEPGTYLLADTNSGAASWDNRRCIYVNVDNITLRFGPGVILKLDDGEDAHVIKIGSRVTSVVTVDNVLIEGVVIDGNRSNQVTPNATDDHNNGIDVSSNCTRVVIRSFVIHDTMYYGIGFQSEGFTNSVVEDGVIYNTGADGFDAKDDSGDSAGNVIRNVKVSNIGLVVALTAQAGINYRDGWIVDGCTVTGLSGDRHGFRHDDPGSDNPQVSQLTNFFVSASSEGTTIGVYINSSTSVDNSRVSAGTVAGCNIGIDSRGVHEQIENVKTINCGTGLQTLQHTQVNNFSARGCDTGLIIRDDTCVVTNIFAFACTIGAQIDAASTLSSINGGVFSGNGTDIVDNGTRTGIRDVAGIDTDRVGSSTFAIDSTGEKTVTVAHNLDFTPNLEDCIVWLERETAVADPRYGGVLPYLTDATNVYVKVYVTTASATGGALGRCRVHTRAKTGV